MKRIGIIESICSGLYASSTHDPVPASLAKEGFAMLTAVTRAVSDDPDLEAVIWICGTITQTEDLEDSRTLIRRTYPAEQGSDLSLESRFSSLLQQLILSACDCDQLILIAPEADQQLLTMVDAFRRAGIRLLNCGHAFVKFASDKLQVARFCSAQNILHPETWLLSDWVREHFDSETIKKCVIKPRFGVGCTDLFIFDTYKHLHSFILERSQLFEDRDTWIVQDWVEGLAASRAALCSDDSIQLQPWMEQVFASQTDLRSGATELEFVVARSLLDVSPEQGQAVFQKLLAQFPHEMLGCVGCDFVLQQENGSWKPTLIEINPRFTTSFVELARTGASSQLASLCKSTR